MARKQRTRSRRERRFVPRGTPPAGARPAPRDERTGAPRETIRPRIGRGAAGNRATGDPSPTLLKNATAEYGFVVKDLRRIGVVGAAVVAALVVASFAVPLFLK